VQFSCELLLPVLGMSMRSFSWHAALQSSTYSTKEFVTIIQCKLEAKISQF